jgi:hypothetical protein
MPLGGRGVTFLLPRRRREARIADVDVHQLWAMGTAEQEGHRLLALWRGTRAQRGAATWRG